VVFASADYRHADRHLGLADQSSWEDFFDSGFSCGRCVRLLAQSASASQTASAGRSATGIAAAFGRDRRAFGGKAVANLRPTFLSMAAAGNVKPIEFNVAFWQIALYGEIGFVGFWFFLMLSLAIDNKEWKTNVPAVQTSVQTIPAEEANRYSVAARKVVDLINAGDYDAVQKLYNAEMSKAFPPKETIDFYTRLAGFGKIESFDGPIANGYRGWIAFRLHCQRGELTMSLALDIDNQNLGNSFSARTETSLHWRIVGPSNDPLATSALAGWFLHRRVAILLGLLQNMPAVGRDQRSGRSFGARSKPDSLGRN
jgi:hypothetical protein